MMTEPFFQEGPILGNQYEDDSFLRSYLGRKIPEKILREIEPDLRRMGERVVTDLLELTRQAEAQPPRYVPYDPWGRRIDSIELSPAWKIFDRISAEEGIVAIGYERKYGALSRVYQFAKLYLFGPSSAIYSCPLAMTDGAARAIELYGDETLKKNALRRLTSRDPGEFWTSGQWMTEKSGGSDVGSTSTVARWENGQYCLYGDKWFTSATTSQMAMTLARIDGAPEGSRGLSLFYLELRDSQGNLQHIQINRLKDKLGTKALPTAELTLEGTPSILVGGEGGGVRKIATLFNITRIYNSCCAIGFMRRGIALAKDYSKRRKAFGKLLSEHPLHQETLATLETELQAGFLLTFRTVELLGKEEMGEATPEESSLLRILTPIVKLFTAKQAVATASEVLESFGGAGYCEDTGLPALLRDSQVLSIWEGTTNVLSLDMLRAIEKENALAPLLADLQQKITGVKSDRLQALKEKISKSIERLPSDITESQARQFALSLGRLYAAALLLEHADWELSTNSEEHTLEAVQRWCAEPLTRF